MPGPAGSASSHAITSAASKTRALHRMPAFTLQRLNMDSSWHLAAGSTGLVLDPWLVGSEVDVARWFNEQWHETEPVAIADVPPHNAISSRSRIPTTATKPPCLRSIPRSPCWPSPRPPGAFAGASRR